MCQAWLELLSLQVLPRNQQVREAVMAGHASGVGALIILWELAPSRMFALPVSIVAGQATARPHVTSFMVFLHKYPFLVTESF